MVHCHPNYQGEGEWGDWVIHGCGNSRKLVNGNQHIFYLENYNRECPSRIVLMIISIDNNVLDIPILIMRTCEEQTELSSNFDLALQTSFIKKYNLDGNPNFIQLTIEKVIDRVYVIEDFLKLFALNTDCTKMIVEDSSLPVDWYSDSLQYTTNILPSTTLNSNIKKITTPKWQNKAGVQYNEALVKD